MSKATIRKMLSDRLLLDLLGDKWTTLVVSNLCDGKGGGQRFNQIKRNVPGISQKSLTQTLRRLERNGLVQRIVHTGRVLAVEYAFTPLGTSLVEPMMSIFEWTAKNSEAVRRAQAQFDRARAEEARDAT